MGEAVLHKYLKEDTSEELCGFGRKYPEHPKNTAFNIQSPKNMKTSENLKA